MSRPAVAFFDLGGVAARFVPERRLPVLRALASRADLDVEERIWASGLSRGFRLRAIVSPVRYKL